MNGKKLKAIYLMPSFIAALVLLFGIFYSNGADAAKKTELSKKTITVSVGKKVTLKLKNNKKKVTWKVVSGKETVTLSKKKKTGVCITGRKKGKAKIQAKAGKKKYTCKVTVVAGAAKTAIPTAAPAVTETPTLTPEPNSTSNPGVAYTFRKPSYLTEHFEKHGAEVGASSELEYLQMANAVISNSNALHKLEAEDNDHVYYIEATNEIVFLSQDGYIRTYFICSGKDYFDRQGAVLGEIQYRILCPDLFVKTYSL